MMKSKHQLHQINKVTMGGLLVTLGIVFGDIGTSPLYVMKAIVTGGDVISRDFIWGGLSCVFWTLTLQTTVKYVIITLRADNKGEGGIFSLFAIVRRGTRWIYLFAIIGGAALLADGVITPSLTILSSVEGLQILNPRIPVVPIVLLIITLLFFFQKYGTRTIGKFFGPVMLVWFVMQAILGTTQIAADTSVLSAINPVYAYDFLTKYPGGFILLGAVFLATTGAEALYSDLGHVGLKNIRITWAFVKVCLLLNYFGQGAWILRNTDQANEWVNPFFAIMPQWFLFTGILIATAAAIIASQALISGSFTLISEAIQLNFWPRIKIRYPTDIKGQMYISSINWMLYFSCVFVVLFFRRSSNMEAAYGLSITITMLMTTALLSVYLYKKRIPIYLIGLLLLTYLTIEGAFLVANLNKFMHGGWFTILLGGILCFIMYIWYNGRKIKNRFIEFVKIDQYYDIIRDFSHDKTAPKFATHAVFLTKADRVTDIEYKIIYSILNRQPKRADVYWLLHIDIRDEPMTFEYRVTRLVPGILFKVDIRLGFKVQPRVNLIFRRVVEEMSRKGELDIVSRYDSLGQFGIPGDFRFVVIDRIQTYDFDFPPRDQFIMNLYTIFKEFGISDVKALGLDTSNVVTETVPLNIGEDTPLRLNQHKAAS